MNKSNKNPIFTILAGFTLWHWVTVFFAVFALGMIVSKIITKGTPAPIEMYNVEEPVIDSVGTAKQFNGS